ncbi:MAG: RagB/SusD family nutrient uptake outer membrane protein, partial [Flavisolibacter sp.]|nr:RagB/SusD family nutrient uptake outer membrane protein [Flavisolibacter sp.]
MTKKIVGLLLLFVTLVNSNSCTKLKEKVLDESSVTGLTDKQIAEGNIAPVYALLPTLYQHTNLFALQEISTDEAILPYRGGTDWGDNGIYISLHRHETASSDPNVNNTWNQIVQSISRSVTAINALATNTDPNAKTFLAEARGMRAFYNLLALDLFGITFQKEDPAATSKILRGEEAINYIRTELLAAEPLLETTTGPGRLTKAGAWGLLARLYLNAAVYRDPYAASFAFKSEDMDKVIEYCDKIISSNQYQLAPEYFSIFDNNNHNNKELIFAIDQRPDLNGHNRMAYFSLSGDQYPVAAAPTANGTDGPAITPEFYQTWVTANAPLDPAQADPRFYKKNLIIPADSCIDAASYKIDRGILRGQQYGLFSTRNGTPFARCANGNYKITKLFHYSRSKPDLPVNFTEAIDFTAAGSNYNTGYRVEKYAFTSVPTTNGRNFGEHDIVILRLADAYLMRAEAKLRKNNDVA